LEVFNTTPYQDDLSASIDGMFIRFAENVFDLSGGNIAACIQKSIDCTKRRKG